MNRAIHANGARLTMLAAFLVLFAATARAQDQNGIKVHGHWIIDVRNADGTLVAHHEFENALANHLGASTFLNGVLTRTKQVGKWAVLAVDLDGQPLLTIVEPGANGYDPTLPVLSITAPTSGPNAGKLVLSGNGTASRNAQIGTVYSQNENCPPPGTAGACTSAYGFSQRGLASAITVVQGQIVQVTVIFSFS